ncbi:hypothetical protein JKY79_02170 [Candidatus Babeliales bacterium]|nr:hypothetical protein [Candidatus Babeliales bacterium]
MSQHELLKEIEKAEKEICVAVYMITSQKISDALIESHKKGVSIKIVTDSGCINSPYGKAYHLLQAGIDIRVFSPPGGNHAFPPLMHTKYAIMDKITVTIGSYNWTNSADHSNEEHLRITKSKKLCLLLHEHFQALFNDRSTDEFDCHRNQILSWNKKNKTATKSIPIFSPPKYVKHPKHLFVQTWHSVCKELSQTLWNFVSNRPL